MDPYLMIPRNALGIEAKPRPKEGPGLEPPSQDLAPANHPPGTAMSASQQYNYGQVTVGRQVPLRPIVQQASHLDAAS